MSAALQQLAQPLLDLAGSSAAALIAYAMAKLAAYFQEHTHNAYLQGLETRVLAAVTSAVTAVEQLVAKDLASGVTAKSAAQLKADALALVKAQLGPGGVAQLATIVGLDQVETVLGAKIESAVLAVNGSSSPAPVTINIPTPSVAAK